MHSSQMCYSGTGGADQPHCHKVPPRQLAPRTLCEQVSGFQPPPTHPHPWPSHILLMPQCAHPHIELSSPPCHSDSSTASMMVSVCELTNRHLARMPRPTALSFGGRKILLKIIVPGSAGAGSKRRSVIQHPRNLYSFWAAARCLCVLPTSSGVNCMDRTCMQATCF